MAYAKHVRCKGLQFMRRPTMVGEVEAPVHPYSIFLNLLIFLRVDWPVARRGDIHPKTGSRYNIRARLNLNLNLSRRDWRSIDLGSQLSQSVPIDNVDMGTPSTVKQAVFLRD